ncbi:MAG: IS91 family transposase, partial [Acidobacteria bacterium]
GRASPTKSSSDPATPEDYRDRYERLTGRSLRECPVCHRGQMIPIIMLAEVRPSPAIPDTS